MSFAINFLVGKTVADAMGKSSAGVASGAAFAATNGSPVGFVLARQIALNSPSPPPVPSTPSKDPRTSYTGTSTTKESDMDEIDKVIQRWIETYQPSGGEKLTPEELRAHLLAALDAIRIRVQQLPLGAGLDPEGTAALKSMLKAIAQAAQQPHEQQAPVVQKTQPQAQKG